MRLAALSLGLMLALSGCMRKTDDASFKDSETNPRRGDPVGYYEINREGAVYVVGSIQSRDKVRAGKPPPTMSAGSSSQGQAVLFETDSAGLEHRLMAEYEKRHGLTSAPPR